MESSGGGGGFISMVWKLVELEEVGREVVSKGGVDVVWRCINYCKLE